MPTNKQTPTTKEVEQAVTAVKERKLPMTNVEEKEMMDKAKKIVDDMKKMNDRYGNNWLECLPKFDGSLLLRACYDKMLDIETFSNESETANKGENMNHLLYCLLHQHFISYFYMLNKLQTITQDNLNKALQDAINCAENLKDIKGSYAWFSNMKAPDTFARTEDIINYYKSLSNIFLNKENIEVRRLHLFYSQLLTTETFIKPLFT